MVTTNTILEIVSIGCEIADSNAEHLTDFDEAVRIFKERNPQAEVPTYGSVEYTALGVAFNVMVS